MQKGGRNYRDLIAWQKAMDLVESIYTITQCFPKEERYALISQLRRAAVSVPSNIAEGQGRNAIGEFVHFLSIAHGSLREIETQLLISQRLRYVKETELLPVFNLCEEVGKLITGLKNSLNARRQ